VPSRVCAAFKSRPRAPSFRAGQSVTEVVASAHLGTDPAPQPMTMFSLSDAIIRHASHNHTVPRLA
jgi:hypothetical protein